MAGNIVGQPGCGCRLPQPGQLTIGEELLGYHNNNNIDLRTDRLRERIDLGTESELRPI